MVVTLDPELEAVLKEQARQQGISPETLALNILRDNTRSAARLQPRDDWERDLLEAARDWGVTLSDSALSSEGLYE